MKVIASKLGFYGKLRQPGDEFEVQDGAKASWFEPVEKPADKPQAKRGAKQDSADLV